MESPSRLTIEVWQWASWPKHNQWRGWVRLDDVVVFAIHRDTETEARAKAEAYVKKLLDHFCAGGR